MKTLNILGSTGSIGLNTLEVVKLYLKQYKINILSAGQNIDLLLKQINQFKPKYAYLNDSSKRLELQAKAANLDVHVIRDEIEYYELLQEPHDITICGIVGIAALKPTLNSIIGAKVLGLANKEVVICAFPFLKQALKENNTKLIPLDSEHNAVYQMIGYDITNVSSIIITASGGPFYDWEKVDFYNAYPKAALSHPNWKMGAKNSIDSATLMNKGLEYIEACELFNLDSAFVDILIHRPSLVHAIVNFTDGSSTLQVNEPNMEVHISKALQLVDGEYLSLPKEPFNFASQPLEFEELDHKKFELPSIAKFVYDADDLSMRIRFNNTNEFLVNRYLEGEINFGNIIEELKDSVYSHRKFAINNLDELFAFSDKLNNDNAT